MRHLACTILTASSLMLSVQSEAAPFWMNETDQPLEMDYCNLQFPASFSGQANTASPTIYGQAYELGTTEAAGPPALLLAQLGYGPAGSDPTVDPNWIWFAATYNVQVGNNDEYQKSITLPAYNGIYSYTFRFSLDGGSTFTAADIGGAGSNAGLSFEPANLGVMTVTDGTDLPEPSSLTLAAMALPMLRRRRVLSKQLSSRTVNPNRA